MPPAGNIGKDTTDDEFRALTDLPLFLGYTMSFFLQGVLCVQIFTYWLAFKNDRKYMKFAVWFVFVLEWTSTILASVAALRSLVSYGGLSQTYSYMLFKALSPLCGLVVLVVHIFYAIRIYMLEGPVLISGLILLFSICQCVMVNIAGFTSPLGVGEEVLNNVLVKVACITWLSFTAINDFLIAATLVIILTRASRHMLSVRTKTRVERGMMICVETGLITGLGALLELVFYFAFKQSFIHFILFYILPKLYSNCMLATLNARLAIPGRKFRGSGEWEWAHRVRSLVALEEKVASFTGSLGATQLVSQSSSESDDQEKRPTYGTDCDSISGCSECSGNIEAFWSTYSPMNKYSFAFHHVSPALSPSTLGFGSYKTAPATRLSCRSSCRSSVQKEM